jgi:hypothetical protein
VEGQEVDLGAPISYLVLEHGTPVYDAAWDRIGQVHRVLSVPEKDLFEGIVISTHLHGHRFVDRDVVAAIHEQGVQLSLSAEEAQRLPEPSRNPAVMRTGPDDEVPESGLARTARRVWSRLSGRY